MTLKPYTHADHAARCREAAQLGHTLQAQHVQVMRRGVLYCAQICNAWTTPDGEDLWTVATTYPETARFTVPCRQVRLCGQDGSCVCLEAPKAPGATQAKRGAQGAAGGSK